MKKKLWWWLIVTLLALAFSCITISIYWMLWVAWCLILPQFWIMGPQAFTQPPFITFVLYAALVYATALLIWLRRE